MGIGFLVLASIFFIVSIIIAKLLFHALVCTGLWQRKYVHNFSGFSLVLPYMLSYNRKTENSVPEMRKHRSLAECVHLLLIYVP